jgi:8-amino-7-oxononanoate synthase
MLGSNNYLGLTVNDEVVKAGIAALDKLGTGCSGSRFLNGTLSSHVELERELADFVGKEGAVAFSTGFQSNLGIISAVCGKGDFIFCDRENHASIYDGCRLSGAEIKVYRHSNMDLLEKKLASVDIDAGKLIVTDGVFSMGGDICRLPDIVELAKKYKAVVMVDDAHGLGVIGEGGRGTASHFGLTDEVDIIMGPFSKSLASLGGFMAASSVICEYVRHNSRPFIFSASIPPASCATALAALRIIKENPSLVDHLSELSVYMKKELKSRGVKLIESPTPIIPLYTKDMITTLTVAKTLYDRGVYVNPVLPPATPPNECLLRVSLMASHTKELIDEAVDIIAVTMKEAGLTDE